MEKDQTAQAQIDIQAQASLLQEEAAAQRLEEERKESALLASIKEFGTNSYYYAHAPKNFNTEGAEVFKGEGLIYGGDPVKLGQREVQKKVESLVAKKITKYSWIDEDTKVKMYIELNQFKGAVTEQMIEVKFEEQAINIKIVDEDCQSHILSIPKLYEKIEPEKSSNNLNFKINYQNSIDLGLYRLRSGKVIVTLHKWLETAWRELLRGKQ